jgi:hypothetical protein
MKILPIFIINDNKYFSAAMEIICWVPLFLIEQYVIPRMQQESPALRTDLTRDQSIFQEDQFLTERLQLSHILRSNRNDEALIRNLRMIIW